MKGPLEILSDLRNLQGLIAKRTSEENTGKKLNMPVSILLKQSSIFYLWVPLHKGTEFSIEIG
jgi:hypothetical protein